MGALLTTPSSGQSELIDTLRLQGALTAGVPLYRIGALVSHRWHGDEDRAGDDPVWEADALTVLKALQGLGYVAANDGHGAAVDLTAGTPPGTTHVVLTGSGRAYARHPRPRPLRVND
jgi:hypothetical protein